MSSAKNKRGNGKWYEEGSYGVLADSVGQALRTDVANTVPSKVECEECLFVSVQIDGRCSRMAGYCVASQSVCEMLSSKIANLIPAKIQRGEGLF